MVVPLRLELFVDLSLGVVADYAGVDEAAEIEAFGSELRHSVYETPDASIALTAVDEKDDVRSEAFGEMAADGFDVGSIRDSATANKICLRHQHIKSHLRPQWETFFSLFLNEY